jgi:hypothetical protein
LESSCLSRWSSGWVATISARSCLLKDPYK